MMQIRLTAIFLFPTVQAESFYYTDSEVGGIAITNKGTSLAAEAARLLPPNCYSSISFTVTDLCAKNGRQTNALHTAENEKKP